MEAIISNVFVLSILLLTMVKPWFSQGRIHWRLVSAPLIKSAALLTTAQQILQLCIAIIIWTIIVLAVFQAMTLAAVRGLSPEGLETFLTDRGWVQRLALQTVLVIWALRWQRQW
jgi:uncharacterized membrane protein